MEFWGVEVKSGKTLDVNLEEGKVLHLSQACLGEIKNNKSNESVCLHINIDGKKLVLGTLNSERLPQQLFDLIFDKDFHLSHNWKNGSVYFYGYMADQPKDTDEEEEAFQLPIPNGKQGAKKEENAVVADKKDGKQKVKIVEPEKDKKADEDDSNSDDDSMSEGSDSDEDNEDSSDGEDSSDEEEETPKKPQSGKKRPNESAIKTPANEKKAKMNTPQKTDGKKAGGHVATPHPSKQGKTPANKSNKESPAASGGAHSCKSCNRNFKSDVALQSHNQAKHK
ncbi:hypothetical protein R6Q59_027567 [Mikania micrantha]|uniref:C2H2-type domain-containing protein n=1 Tax=Mikania micrantha TaxID=192012 RepID=A0A5N6MA77_9ASTR|nr:hypothetical protein E3N88_33059 [Mikania micrantha]KAD3337580.1 hypothetical protein E3N88_33100 [Mikania micrantha]